MSGKLASWRNWHLWLGLLSAIPVLIIGITTIYLVHKKSFDKEVTLPKLTLFSSATAQTSPSVLHGKAMEEMRGVLLGKDGTVVLASKNALFLLDPDHSRASELGTEAYDLAQGAQQLLLATKYGLLAVRDNALSPALLDQRVRSVSGDERLIATTDTGIYLSTDGGYVWQQIPVTNETPLSRIHSVAEGPQGTLWIGGKGGLLKVSDAGPVPLEAFAKEDVRDLEWLDSGLLIATKSGLWRMNVNTSDTELLADGDYRSIVRGPAGITATGKQGIMRSLDQGLSWAPWMLNEQQVAALPASMHYQSKDKAAAGITIRVGKIMKDLHTGKFLGSYAWIWGDLLALGMIFFVISGLVSWRKVKRSAA